MTQRHELATAITTWQAALDQLPLIEDAIAQLPKLWELQQAVDEAETALADATAQHRNDFYSRKPGHNLDDPLQSARQQLNTVTQRLDAAREHQTELEQAKKLAESRINLTRISINDAVGRMLRSSPEVGQLVEYYHIATRWQHEIADALYAISAAGGIPAQHRHWQDDHSKNGASTLTKQLWVAAIERLATDAQVELPPSPQPIFAESAQPPPGRIPMHDRGVEHHENL
jgi:hypothetical protein